MRVNVEVHEGIHRLSRGVCNFYLIEQSGKFILVDAGAPGDWAFFGQALTSLGGKLADLDAVLLTHAHPDHVGIANPGRRLAGRRPWNRAGIQAAAEGVRLLRPAEASQ